MLSMYCTCKNCSHFQLAEHARKFVPRMLSVRLNRFRVCSACDKIVSAYAQHTHAIIFEDTQKYQIKMQILTINNRNFQKPSRNPSKRTKVKILTKKCFGQLIKKIWFRLCSVTAEMFEHRNSGENRRKRSKKNFENLRRAYKDLIQVKKIPNYLMLVYL